MDGSLFPKTRWQALGWALKEHFPRFVLLSLLSFLFAFPLWVYFLFFSFYFSAPEPFSLPSLLSYLALIPLNAIAFLGQGGLFWCARKTAFLEGSSPKEDFFFGVRRTFRESLLSGVLFSSLYVLLKFALSLLFSLSLPSFAYPCLSGFLYCLAFLLGLSFSFLLPQGALYSSSVSQSFLNSWRFFLGGFLGNVPLYLAFCLPWIVFEIFPYFWVYLGLSLFYFLFYAFFSALLWTYRSHALFDEGINKASYPEIYRKGLRK